MENLGTKQNEVNTDFFKEFFNVFSKLHSNKVIDDSDYLKMFAENADIFNEEFYKKNFEICEIVYNFMENNPEWIKLKLGVKTFNKLKFFHGIFEEHFMNKYIYKELLPIDIKKYFKHMYNVFQYFINDVLQEPLDSFKNETGIFEEEADASENEFSFCFEYKGKKYAIDIFNNIDVFGYCSTLYDPADYILSANMYEFRDTFKISSVKLQITFSFNLEDLKVIELFNVSYKNLTNTIRRASDVELNKLIS